MKKTLIFAFASLFFWSCNLEEINENPNVPLEVPLSTLLPPAQRNLASAQGRRIFRYTGIFAKQLTGIENQELTVEVYQPDEFFVGDAWGDLYAGSLLNLAIIVDRASEASPHYAGVARVLMAHGFGTLTDIWGDVPYSEALQRSGPIDHPKFDSQEEIYAAIFELLDRAVSDLESPNSVFSPGSDDLMYGGDLNRWIQAARVLKARYALRTSKRDPNAAGTALEALLVQSMQSPGDDLQYSYLGTGDEVNPIGGFFVNTRYAIMSQYYLDLVSGLSDPRASTITRVIPLVGGRRPGNYWSQAGSPLRLVTYIEQEFIKAEAYLRTGATDQAQLALENAVRTSMDEVSEGAITDEQANDYISAQVQLNGNENDNLRTILTQKYIAMLTTPEPWADFRRTGFPELTPNENGFNAANPNGEIPRRLIYPQSERLRNNNFPQPSPNMQTRFWWDME